MNSIDNSIYDSTRRTVRMYLGILLGVVVLLGISHYFFEDFKAGRISWFNLDEERNIPTWFSGVLFLLFGCSAIIAYAWERKRNAEDAAAFRLPILWLGVGLAGLYMSLDEITILHENLLWREVRHVSAQFSDSWKYVTQWQILFAPAILIILGYFVLFFSNRFSISPGARRSAFTGIGCWVVALLLEGLRGTFKQAGAGWYSFQVVIEEVLEMAGAIFLLAAIIFYIIDIALDFTTQRRDRLGLVSRFLTRQAVTALAIIFVVLSASGGAIFIFAQRQASTGAPVPRLIKKAAESRSIATKKTTRTKSSRFEVSPGDVWFDNVQGTTPLEARGAELLLRAAAKSLSEGKSSLEDISAAFQADVSPRIVFLSASDGKSHAQIAIGAAKGIKQALERAISSIQRVIPGTPDRLWIKFDIVQDINRVATVNFNRAQKFDRSLFGIAFDRSTGIAFLPDELVAHTLVNSKQRIRSTNITKYLKERAIDDTQFQKVKNAGNLTLYRFTTISYFSDGEKVLQLYRGHRLFEQIDSESLLTAARRGGHYLVQAVGSDGKFVYSYLPKSDKVPEKYNILRHAGTIYAMLELYEITGEQELFQAASRALEYLLQSILPCSADKKDTLCVVEDDEVKLGGNALAAIAIAKYIELTGDRKHMTVLQKLGKWIQSVQNEDGEFRVHKQTYPSGKVDDFVSQYYPGEALLAMARIYALDADEGWLDTAEKGAKWLINVRDKGVPIAGLNHDHWLLYALNELYRYRRDVIYLSHTSRIVTAIVQGQNRNPDYPDWFGSYYQPPRSTPTAIRSEGLYAAYQLLRDFGDPQKAGNSLEAMGLGIAFQLQTQFRPESVFYLKDPQRALGGFHRSLTDYEIRIDYVQHNISSLLGMYRLLNDGNESSTKSGMPLSD